MKPLKNIEIVDGARVFVSADLDVPIENGVILNTFRLDQGIRTLKYIIGNNAKPIIGGHIKQPHGVPDPEISTQHLINYYDQQLGSGNYELLENLRFDIREEQNDDSYARELASIADIFVNENFSTSHREHTSIVGIPKYLPAYAGIRFEEEINYLKRVFNNPRRPMIAVVGGAKLESKKPAIDKLLNIAEGVLVGGTLGLQWEGPVPRNLEIPIDYATDNKDIGELTADSYKHGVKEAQTIVWAGPMGLYEDPNYMNGTRIVAEAIAKTAQKGAFCVVGGGNTIDALEKLNLLDQMSFVSTGGGAMLKYIVDETLPGLEALEYA